MNRDDVQEGRREMVRTLARMPLVNFYATIIYLFGVLRASCM